MAEIKEFLKKENTVNNTPKSTSRPNRLPLASLMGFGVLFLLDLFLVTQFTKTSIIFSCILLVLQVVIAVSLDRLNYAMLLGVAIVEMIVGFIMHQFLLVFLSILVYFGALFVIHIMRQYGGAKVNS